MGSPGDAAQAPHHNFAPGNIRAAVLVEGVMTLTPTSPAPRLSLPMTAGGSTDALDLGTGADGRFTLVVFFRGLHCPVCRKQLTEIERRRSPGRGRRWSHR